MSWIAYNKTSNVHQTNKKVQGHDTKPNKNSHEGKDEALGRAEVSACMNAEGPENSHKVPIIQEDRGKKMQEVTVANGNT